jgi:hypothetical protein
MSHAGLREAIRSAEVSVPSATGRVGGVVQRSVVMVFETVAGLVFRADETEVERRFNAGLGTLRRLDVLDVLMNLPRGLGVPWAELAAGDRRALERLPDGVVERSGAGVTRLASAPVVPELAIVAAADWHSGLKKAGQYAPYCARSVLLPKAPTGLELAEARARAALYGVGLCVLAGGGLQVVAEPEPFVRRRHTPAQWWFAEQVWDQVSDGYQLPRAPSARPAGRPTR